jgi:transposase
VAFDLGLHPNTLYRWRSEVGVAGAEAFPGQGRMAAGDDEVRRLQREISRLRQERDILKKPSPSSPRKTHEVPVHR